ncbi:OmpA family protein [Candidatus Marithrix sp. Canyon 246]|uniref:OmpA family protein n=1 Tax=Candidatus Marithrix sp. Canyon 246 TaxID=1827136 RepID=UPI0009F42111|nr:OmpA family protein [Candidatus Marithrix sp. Canyon 246]
MIKHKITSIAIGATLLAGSVTANAATPTGFYAGPTVGYFFFDDETSNNAEDGVYYGLGLGYQISKNFAIEANYSRLGSEITNSLLDNDRIPRGAGQDLDLDMFRVDGIFNLDLNSPLSPYLAIGYARFEQDPQFGDDDDMINAGLGMRYALTPAMLLRADARAFYNFDNEEVDYAANLGVFYAFGAKAPAPVIVKEPEPEPEQPTEVDPCTLDDDGDGVNNCDDKCSDTPAGSNVETTGCRILEIPKEIELKVLFDYDKAIVKPEYYEEIKQVADFMAKYPSTSTEIQGHTDSRGSDSYNQDLSQQRADAVLEVLVNEYQINPSRLRAVGYGEAQPLVSSEVTEEDYQMNRRVIARIETVVKEVEGQ